MRVNIMQEYTQEDVRKAWKRSTEYLESVNKEDTMTIHCGNDECTHCNIIQDAITMLKEILSENLDTQTDEVIAELEKIIDNYKRFREVTP